MVCPQLRRRAERARTSPPAAALVCKRAEIWNNRSLDQQAKACWTRGPGPRSAAFNNKLADKGFIVTAADDLIKWAGAYELGLGGPSFRTCRSDDDCNTSGHRLTWGHRAQARSWRRRDFRNRIDVWNTSTLSALFC